MTHAPACLRKRFTPCGARSTETLARPKRCLRHTRILPSACASVHSKKTLRRDSGVARRRCSVEDAWRRTVRTATPADTNGRYWPDSDFLRSLTFRSLLGGIGDQICFELDRREAHAARIIGGPAYVSPNTAETSIIGVRKLIRIKLRTIVSNKCYVIGELQRFLFTGEKTCMDCHKGISHRLPDMRNVPGWQ